MKTYVENMLKVVKAELKLDRVD